MLPRESLEKRWSVSNSGSCDWGPDYRLVHVGTSEIEGPAEVALFPASAGSTAVWEVALVAPSAPGEYLGRWQARAPDGSLFGDEVFVLIVVSYLTSAPKEAQLVGLTYATVSAEHRRESWASWNRWDVINSGIVLFLILMAYLYFRG